MAAAAFMAIFICAGVRIRDRGIAGLDRAQCDQLAAARRISQVPDLADAFLRSTGRTGPLLSRMTYNVEMVAESVTSVVTIAIRDVLTVFAAFA